MGCGYRPSQRRRGESGRMNWIMIALGGFGLLVLIWLAMAIATL